MELENRNIARVFISSRQKLGISQRKMARKLQINQSTISRIEAGAIFPRKMHIERLEDVMQMSLRDLFGLVFRSAA